MHAYALPQHTQRAIRRLTDADAQRAAVVVVVVYRHRVFCVRGLCVFEFCVMIALFWQITIITAQITSCSPQRAANLRALFS